MHVSFRFLDCAEVIRQPVACFFFFFFYYLDTPVFWMLMYICTCMKQTTQLK